MPHTLDLDPPPALAWLMDRQAASPAPFRILGEACGLLPNLGAVHGLWDPRGNDPMRPADAAEVVGTVLDHTRSWSQTIVPAVESRHQPLLDFVALRFLLTEHDRSLPSPWRSVFDGVGGRVWENPAALPLFFMPPEVHWVMRGKASFKDGLGISDYATHVNAVGPRRNRFVERSGSVLWTLPRANGFDLEFDIPTGGIVSSSISFARGWSAAIEGFKSRIVKLDGGFLGFNVPKGRHRVKLRYSPRTWPWSLALFAAGVLSIPAFSAARRRSAARPDGQAADVATGASPPLRG